MNRTAKTRNRQGTQQPSPWICRENVGSVGFLLCAVYLVVALSVRDPAKAIIPTSLVLLALLLLLVMIVYLQCQTRALGSSTSCSEQPQTPYRIHPAILEASEEQMYYHRQGLGLQSRSRSALKVVPQELQSVQRPGVSSLDEWKTERDGFVSYSWRTTPQPHGKETEKSRNRLPPDSYGTVKYIHTARVLGHLQTDNRPNMRATQRTPETSTQLSLVQKQQDQAVETAQKLNVHKAIVRWTEKVRSWIGNTLLPRVLQLHEENLLELDKLLNPLQRRLVFHRAIPAQDLLPRTPLLWEELLAKTKNDAHVAKLALPLPNDNPDIGLTAWINPQLNAALHVAVEQRKNLEMYFRLPGYSADVREYILGRLKELVHNLSTEYKHNGGGCWQGTQWTSRLPCDSDVRLGLNIVAIVLAILSYNRPSFLQAEHIRH